MMYSTHLDQVPETPSLVPLNPVWTITVRDISTGSTARTLTVAVAGLGTVYTWTESARTTAPEFTSSYTYDGDTLTVTLATSAAHGAEYVFTTTYSDSAVSLATVLTYVAGEPSLLAQNPVKDAQDVSPLASVLFDIGMASPVALVGVRLLLNGEVAYDTGSEFTRPDYEGRAVVSPRFVSINVNWRRNFNEGQPVDVEATIRCRSPSSAIVYKTYQWRFFVAKRRTVVTQLPAVTAIDLPAARGIVEVFRTAGIASVKPPASTVPSALLLFYAVQNSGLSSLAPYLPGAQVLELETPALRAVDLVAPVTGYANLIAVEPFFEVFLRELVIDGTALPQEVEMLERAWRANTPTNRIAAVAAALLYAFPVST